MAQPLPPNYRNYRQYRKYHNDKKVEQKVVVQKRYGCFLNSLGIFIIAIFLGLLAIFGFFIPVLSGILAINGIGSSGEAIGFVFVIPLVILASQLAGFIKHK